MSEAEHQAKLSAGSCAFPRTYRLCKTDEFSSVFAFRKALRGRFFMLHYRPNGSDRARLGAVVAKRLAKRAVQRNLLKRLAREAFRQRRAELSAHDLILRLHVSVREATRAQLREDIASLLRRLPR
ncbi:MAG: ribonuclease P protein component [Pseudomonas sp.]|nr:ribonuclease P protein component [Pseudomonas sp.]